MWDPVEQTEYLEFIEKYDDKLLLEVVGHEHWQDLRFTTSPKTGKKFRPLLIGVGVSLDNR